MNKKPEKTALVLLFCVIFPVLAWANPGDPGREHKNHKDNFYKAIHVKSGINRADLDAARLDGFSPMTAYMLARLAKVTKAGIKTVLAMHENGMTWKDMCEKYGVDYEKFMEETTKAIKEDNIVFPQGSPEEGLRDAAAPGKKKGAVK